MEGDLPVWSGDGRHSVANPMMPIYQADGRASYGAGQTGHTPSGSSQTSNPAGRTLPPQVLPATGDGKGSVDLSNELSMTVNSPATVEAKPARKSRSKKTRAERTGSRAERSETWKLVALVVIFLIWVSTASTLLFLYMDRYLFP